MAEVKHARRSGTTRLSRKHQATIPVDVLRLAGIKAGDQLVVKADGAGRVLLERFEDLIQKHAGKGAGDYPAGYLEELRSEWR